MFIFRNFDYFLYIYFNISVLLDILGLFIYKGLFIIDYKYKIFYNSIVLFYQKRMIFLRELHSL